MVCKCYALLIVELQISPCSLIRTSSLSEQLSNVWVFLLLHLLLLFWTSERDSGKNMLFICQSGTWEILCKSSGTSHSCCISPVRPICVRDMAESTLEIRLHNMRWMKQCGRLGELPWSLPAVIFSGETPGIYCNWKGGGREERHVVA